MVRLLVSVRNLAEAHSALEGGCDLVDLKEPLHGALGMVDPATIAAVCDFVSGSDTDVLLSVALGEALDWRPERAVPTLPAAVSYFKLGTAGLAAVLDWPSQLAFAVRQFQDAFGSGRETASVRIATCAGANLEDDVASAQPACRTLAVSRTPYPIAIAVTYADVERAASPAPEEVLREAARCGCGGVLIDTCGKENGHLLDWCEIERLRSLALQARRSRLTFAVAGSLQTADLPDIRTLDAEIVGIRSAACREGRRTAQIDAASVRGFREALASREIMAAN